MLRVDFYILPHADEKNRLSTVCRYVQKCYQEKQTIFLYVQNRAQALTIDELIWTQNDISFIPHQICNEPFSLQPNTPIYIGWEKLPVELKQAIVINLTLYTPSFANECQHLVEFIPNVDENLQRARDDYRTYKQLGATLTHVKLH